MPKTKYYNPQNDVVKLMDGKRVPVQPYNMYQALHAVPQAPARSETEKAVSPVVTPAPQTEEVYFLFDGQYMTLVENYGNNSVVRRMPAVSGRQNEDGSFSYSKERQHMKNEGPIPEGRHNIELSSIRYVKDAGFFNRAASVATDLYNAVAARTPLPTIDKVGAFPGGDRLAWGEGSVDIKLDPQVARETERDGLTVHGGWFPGSAGCIDLVDNDKEFFKQLERFRDKRDEIPLIVDYSQTPEKVYWERR